ncbi:hypothetical protein LI951_05320 [Enterococcus sp. BWT-B8]|uniref:lectin-like domain-containing protein n=1 Tax=Enterococcus sp. BWT-B8 TaxID=2885157 RepID=UPI001E34D25C|nr:hypothetical protein [Enterococcus sp. BWT-B8]MCB5951478.1 hypothetical protein [Enterococcus sp. BWT-B8]
MKRKVLCALFLMIIYFYCGQGVAAAEKGADKIPKGAIQIEGLFTSPNGSGIQVNNINDPSQNGGFPYTELKLSGRSNWVSVWSESTYRLDFTKSFNGRAYVNFGTTKADGFAFVMHNDPNGRRALTTENNESTDGQNLGVYGAARSSKSGFLGTTLHTPEEGAIKNSVAVEFDLYANRGDTSVYDVRESNGPHVAYSFPGNLEKGYQAVGPGLADEGWWFTGLLKETRNARIKHYQTYSLPGILGDRIQDGTWYEFIYSFETGTKSFSYQLRNPVTGKATPIVKIPWADLNQELKLATNGYKAYWGFSAANGIFQGETAFVFTQVPVELSGEVKSDVVLKDGTGQESSVVVAETDELGSVFVSSDDSVSLKSTFSVRGELPYEVSQWNGIVEAGIVENEGEEVLISYIRRNGAGAVIGSTQHKSAILDVDGQIKVAFNPGELRLLSGESVEFFIDNIKIRRFVNNHFKTNFMSYIEGRELSSVSNFQSFFSLPAYFWVNAEDRRAELSWTPQNSVKEKELITSGTDVLTIPFYWKDPDTGDSLNFVLAKEGGAVIDTWGATALGSESFVAASLTIPQERLEQGQNVFTLDVYNSELLPSFSQDQIILIVNVPQSAQVKVEFINEENQVMSGYTLTIGEGQTVDTALNVGDVIDLTGSEFQAVQDQLAALETAGYEISVRPENETNFAITEPVQTVTYKVAGQLFLKSAPSTVDFGSITYNAKVQRVDNPSTDGDLVITDTRANQADGWTLYAALTTNMKNEKTGSVMNEALWYVDSAGEEFALTVESGNQPIYTNASGGTFAVTDTWGDTPTEPGLKLVADPTKTTVSSIGTYSGVVTWTIMAGQP